jgi:hypothetical protein
MWVQAGDNSQISDLGCFFPSHPPNFSAIDPRIVFTRIVGTWRFCLLKILISPRKSLTIEPRRGFMRDMGFGKTLGIIVAFCVVMAIESPAQTFTELRDFTGPNGAKR